MSLPAVVASLHSVASLCASRAAVEASRLDDEALLALQSSVAAVGRQIELALGALAAEIAVRSRPELGYSGLAQRRGSRTPEALVQSVTGSSVQTARRLVQVGGLVSLLRSESPSSSPVPWLQPLVLLVSTGDLSAEAVEIVRSAIGPPSESVSCDDLLAAVQTLSAEATSLTFERLAARARELRDELDVAGVAAREAERRERRFLRLYPQLDGMTRISGLLDPESAATLVAVIDDATSPRRGGPRFVDPTVTARAETVVQDPRTTEQLALDALVELVDVAVRSRPTGVLGARRPDVRVLVTQRDLDRRSGVGSVDGQSASVSVATVERLACDGGLVPIMFDDATGAGLNLGRSQRLHNARQRTVIAARDGGCIAPGCDRPVSWTEVHHIHEFSKGGSTDVADGVLLCRHHHLLMHNNGWRIIRLEHAYLLIPPPDIDPQQRPIPLRSKSAAVRRLMGAASG